MCDVCVCMLSERRFSAATWDLEIRAKEVDYWSTRHASYLVLLFYLYVSFLCPILINLWGICFIHVHLCMFKLLAVWRDASVCNSLELTAWTTAVRINGFVLKPMDLLYADLTNLVLKILVSYFMEIKEYAIKI